MTDDGLLILLVVTALALVVAIILDLWKEVRDQ